MTDDVRDSLITGTACWLGTVLALLLGLQNPYWATMTAWSTSLPGQRLGVLRAVMQVLATAIGCFVGYQSSLRTEARPGLQLLALFLFAAGGTYMRFRSRFNYAWGLGSFSAIMLSAITLYNPAVLYTDAYFRGYEIICGIVAVLITQVGLGGALDLMFPRPTRAALLPAPAGMLDRRDAAHIGIVGGATVVLVPVIWYVLHLPIGSLLITMIAPLVALDVVFISSPIRTHWRLVGSLVGGVAGIMASAVASDSFFLWSLFLLGGLGGAAYVRGSKHPWAISSMQLGLSFLFALVAGSGPSSDSELVINKIAGLAIGLLVMIVVAYTVRLFFQDRPAAGIMQRMTTV